MKFSSLFSILMENKTISVSTGSKKEHDNLRVRLCRNFSKHKSVMLSLDPDDVDIGLSISASYVADSGVSTFYVRERKGFGSSPMEEGKDYEIVENPNVH